MQLNFHFLLLFCFLTVGTYSQRSELISLNIDDPAPSLRVSEWIKGTPVHKFEKGRVYVIEFWATWCRPCIAAMPHLSVLARQYKDDVTVIGIDAYEAKLKPVRSNKKVKAFVDSIGDRMDFSVAIEDSNFTVTDWIEATGERNSGIPRSFVVNGEGRLAWIGHPSKLDEVLPKIVTGAWDTKEALAIRNLNRRLEMLDDSLNYELMRYDGDRFKPNDLGKPDSALLMINEIIRHEPKLKFGPFIVFHTFSALLKTDLKKAYEYGKEAIVTPAYEIPPFDIIIGTIEWYADKLRLTKEIYALGGEAYEVEISQIPYPEIVNMPKLYNNMAEMFWHANNKLKAIDAQQKAIDALKSRKNYLMKDMSAFESRLQQYKNM